MGRFVKITLVRKASQMPKLKSTGYSIILGRNLVKKQKEEKGKLKDLEKSTEQKKSPSLKNRYWEV